ELPVFRGLTKDLEGFFKNEESFENHQFETENKSIKADYVYYEKGELKYLQLQENIKEENILINKCLFLEDSFYLYLVYKVKNLVDFTKGVDYEDKDFNFGIYQEAFNFNEIGFSKKEKEKNSNLFCTLTNNEMQAYSDILKNEENFSELYFQLLDKKIEPSSKFIEHNNKLDSLSSFYYFLKLFENVRINGESTEVYSKKRGFILLTDEKLVDSIRIIYPSLFKEIYGDYS
ncbi:MAG: hypothetical protein U9Q99_03350, partial [Nanoarchaeota archaeon]|nr:hypothetical protein [Nanoarchaeota archaeon]